MDKKNTVIGVLLLLAAVLSFYYSMKLTPPAPKPPVTIRPPGNPLAPNEAEPGGYPPAISPTDATFATVSREDAAAKHLALGNDFIEVTFTNTGGAIQKIALKKYAAMLGRPDPYVFNEVHVAPALSFADFPGLDAQARYTLVSKTTGEIVYRTVLDGRIEVTRRYRLHAPGDPTGDPYQIRHETIFRNLTDKTEVLPRLALNLGTSSPVNANDLGYYLNVGYYDGSSAKFIGRSALEGGGLLAWVGLASRGPVPFIEKPVGLVWASVKNQFFTGILTPDEPGAGVIVRRVELPPFPGGNRPAVGVTGSALFNVKPLAAGAQAVLGATYYVGPKEYSRLAATDNFKHSEDKVMEFGFFGFFSQILLTMMTWVHHHLVANWGVAIVLTTLILKAVFMPLTLSASRSSKHMAKLQPFMQALREKHKDNPQKLQTETMKLFKENKVNPVGGCIPILITIPFFIGFFRMLQGASELRFASFLWARDLSAPDTVARILGLPLNIMALLMGATMIIQMRLAPTPTVDNAQAKMFKFMPYFFTLICYNFSCALALYSTVGNGFTIFQQMIINRLPEPELPATAGAAGPGDRPVKNVTPQKKRLKGKG